MSRLVRLLALLQALFCVPALAAEPGKPSYEIVVFAAASLTEAVGQIAQAYEKKSQQLLKTSFASSSTLARQIENGAAADIFISADEEWMEYLDKRQLIVEESWSRPIGNRLVLIARADWPGTVPLERDDNLAVILGDDRLATGDPDHVPVGRYARQALEYLGAWKTVAPKLARAENVRAALALVERGEAPLGIVYATDALVAKSVKVVAEFPEQSHEPIRYSFAILAGHDNPEVRGAFAFLTSAAALEVFRKQGFLVP